MRRVSRIQIKKTPPDVFELHWFDKNQAAPVILWKQGPHHTFTR